MDFNQAKVILQKAEYWHYPFDLPWGRTSPQKPGHGDRHFLRRRHFFEPLIASFGGSLTGKRVLDLGCCQGFWSFESVKSGAALALGIDSSTAFIQEAEALKTVLNFRDCSFFRAHLENDPWWAKVEEGVDITLFLGLFYHLTDPVFVLRKAMALTREVMIVDTEVAYGETPSLFLVPRNLEELTTRKSGLTSALRTVPTVAALVELLKDGGFPRVTIFNPATDMPGEYRAGLRVSILARRE